MSGLKSLRFTAACVTRSIRMATSTGTPRFFHWLNAIAVTPSAADACACVPKYFVTLSNAETDTSQPNINSLFPYIKRCVYINASG